MREQVAHRDLACGRPRLALADQNFGVGELWDVLRDRIIEPDLAVLDQLHRCNRDDRLCHRIDAEDRLRRHRVRIPRAFGSNGRDVHHLAAPGDKEKPARNLARRDAGLDVCLRLLECSGVEAERGGLGRHGQRGLVRISGNRRRRRLGDFGCRRCWRAGGCERKNGGGCRGEEVTFHRWSSRLFPRAASVAHGCCGKKTLPGRQAAERRAGKTAGQPWAKRLYAPLELVLTSKRRPRELGRRFAFTATFSGQTRRKRTPYAGA